MANFYTRFRLTPDPLSELALHRTAKGLPQRVAMGRSNSGRYQPSDFIGPMIAPFAACLRRGDAHRTHPIENDGVRHAEEAGPTRLGFVQSGGATRGGAQSAYEQERA